MTRSMPLCLALAVLAASIPALAAEPPAASDSSGEDAGKSSKVVKLTKEYFVGEWVGGNLLYWYRLELKNDGSAVFGYVFGNEDPKVYIVEHWELPEGKPIVMEPKSAWPTGKTSDDIVQLTVSHGGDGVHLVVRGSDWEQEAQLFRAQRVEEGLTKLTKAALAAEPLPAVERIDKKLIEYGWDVPTPDYIRANIAEMEKLPFDGLIFHLKAGDNALQPAPYDEAAYAEDFDNCANIAWQKFTDNFIRMLAASDQDWFDDSHWQAIEHNVRIVAKAGKLAKCAGICFDPEPYGTNPWDYKKLIHKDDKSFAEYQAKVRERGAQFVRAIEAELPNPKILTFYLFGMWKGRGIAGPLAPEERMQKLSGEDYALYPAFINGMFDAAGDNTVIIDGNEHAYYYTDPAEYLANYHFVYQTARYLVDPALWKKYRSTVQSGQALYLDYYFNLRNMKDPGAYLTPEEQPKWFEHNVYNALNTADEYVWCYSEHMNWWKNEVPPGSVEAIKSAQQKIQNRQPLGFDLKLIIQPALEKREKEK